MTHDTSTLATTPARHFDSLEDGDCGSAFQPLPQRQRRTKRRRNPKLWALIFGAVAAGISLLITAGDHAFAQKEQATTETAHHCDM